MVSGFTTTGGSILTEVESLPRGILFWRSFASWIGGMGVLIFTLAFLPKVGGRTQVLVQAESPGPVASKLVPKTAMSSRILYCIYIVFTAAETIALRIAGMPWFDAITTTFATVCTGGLSVRNLSIASYNLPACEIIITVFMLLCSLNFAAFFLVITGRLRQALGSDELKFFLLAVVLAVVVVFGNILPLYDTAGHAFRDAWFQVASIVSTTGFATTDFALWPVLPQFVLLLLMFLGGCAGSTAGGIKASRVLLMFRCAHRSLRRLIHPRAVKVVKLDGKPVDEDTLNTVFVFFLCFMAVLGLGCLIVCLDGFSLTTLLHRHPDLPVQHRPRPGVRGPHGELLRLLPPEQVGALPGHAHRPSGGLSHPHPPAALHLAEGLRENPSPRRFAHPADPGRSAGFSLFSVLLLYFLCNLSKSYNKGKTLLKYSANVLE